MITDELCDQIGRGRAATLDDEPLRLREARIGRLRARPERREAEG
jgi:hypothetical protein